MQGKIRGLRKILKDKKANALFLHWKDPNHKWLLGEKLEDSFVLVRKTGKPLLFISPLESFKSKKFRVVIMGRDLKKRISSYKIKRLAVNNSFFTLKHKEFFGKASFVDVSKDLLKIRSVKDESEIRKIRKACTYTVKCFNELIRAWKKKQFKHELDVVRFIKRFALDNDLGLAFEPIVASGKNACVPHHSKHTTLNKGFCVVDFGFEYKGYNSDMTRTLYIGKPSEEEREYYDLVRSVQESCVEMVEPGVLGRDLNDSAVKMLGDKARFFVHSLGHGIGVEVHEKPGISGSSEEFLVEGMVLTVEPGVYIHRKRVGIRIEDTILVSRKGFVNLTRSASKNLVIVV